MLLIASSTLALNNCCKISEFALVFAMADDIEYVISKLPDRPGTWRDLAAAAGVGYHFVQKLGCNKATGYSRSGYQQIQKLAAYFREQERTGDRS